MIACHARRCQTVATNLRRLLLLLSAFLGLFVHQALAQIDNCGCDSTATWDAAFDKANIVFLGTCIDVAPNTLKGGLNVAFEVDSSWKRAIERVATVHTNSPNQCGYPFRMGERYIVFANKRHQIIATTACEPNQLYDDNGLLTLRRLGKGFTPGRPGKAQNMIIMLTVLGLLGLLFLGFVVLRKKIRPDS
jgi:hypothetical protein